MAKYVSHYSASRRLRRRRASVPRLARAMELLTTSGFVARYLGLYRSGGARPSQNRRVTSPEAPCVRPCAAPPRPRKKKNVADPSGTALYDAEASLDGSKAERKLKLRSPNNRRGENSDPNRFGSAAARAGSGAGLRGAHAQQPGGATTVIRAHGRRRRGRKGCPNQAWVAQNLPRRWSREEVGPRRPSCAS